RPPTSISPEVGFSRPAIERKVVVLPQPEGPSSVNSLPSGTSNDTFCAALTAPPRSSAYSVNSDLTLSTFHPLGFFSLCSSTPAPARRGRPGGGPPAPASPARTTRRSASRRAPTAPHTAHSATTPIS